MIDHEAHAQLASEEVTILWSILFNDTMYSGIIEHGGRLFYCELVDDTPELARYVVRALTPEQHAEEARWLPLYHEHVQGRPAEEWRTFYEAYDRRENKTDYQSRPVVAWFEIP